MSHSDIRPRSNVGRPRMIIFESGQNRIIMSTSPSYPCMFAQFPTALTVILSAMRGHEMVPLVFRVRRDALLESWYPQMHTRA